jgi:hypothetical protein
MNQKQLQSAAVRTLRAGIIRTNPPGDRRARLLVIYRSANQQVSFPLILYDGVRVALQIGALPLRVIV